MHVSFLSTMVNVSGHLKLRLLGILMVSRQSLLGKISLRDNCGPRVGARGLEPRQGASGNMGPLRGASEWPTLFSRSVDNGRPSPRPLKSCPGPLRAFPGL